MIALGAVLCVALSPDAAFAGRAVVPLQETLAGAVVDWATGTLTAAGGAASDLRMPSADAARPGAQRRARAVAHRKLKVALAALPMGGDRRLPLERLERALSRARSSAQYQSNGGAIVTLVVSFADWLPPAHSVEAADGAAVAPAAAGATGAAGQDAGAPVGGADIVITAPSARLAAAPILKVGRQEAAVGAAVYRFGAPPSGTRVVAAKPDRAGRLVLESGPDVVEKLAGALVVIYVRKVTR